MFDPQASGAMGRDLAQNLVSLNILHCPFSIVRETGPGE